jgi:cell fate (sporulation/competence/biofilm development) regulator YlbF (YheA/YmcA/DUF963 family)
MKTPLDQIQDLEELIRQMHKIDSKLDAGHIIRAYRENGKIIAYLERVKANIVSESKKTSIVANVANDSPNPIDQMQELEDVIRQLHKISSLIYAGQIVQAYGSNYKLIAILKRKLYEVSTKG